MKNYIIYEPRGKAREYAPLAVNVYSGCSHACEYCYSPAYLHIPQVEFRKPKPRKDILQKLTIDANKLKQQSETGPVLLCFTCDPYQPINEHYQLTRQAVQILHSFGLNVMILTKGGLHAERDFDLLTNSDWFGVTLTNLDNTLSRKWEPGAALPESRIQSLQNAHEKGIKTWVSLEPVLYTDVALEIIRRTYSFVDNFKVGTLNYHPYSKNIDWHKFVIDVKSLLVELNCDYYLKEDLRKWL